MKSQIGFWRQLMKPLLKKLLGKLRGGKPVLWGIEYSWYSENNGMYPLHIDYLHRIVLANMNDFWSNRRGDNKWQIICIGTYEECSKIIDALHSEYERRLK
jgi:hypothetical protein